MAKDVFDSGGLISSIWFAKRGAFAHLKPDLVGVLARLKPEIVNFCRQTRRLGILKPEIVDFCRQAFLFGDLKREIVAAVCQARRFRRSET